MRRRPLVLGVWILLVSSCLLAGRAAADALPRGLAEALARREYQATPNARGLQAPNRAHGLRTWFEPTGIRVHERTGDGSELLALTLTGVGRGDALAPVAPGEVVHDGARVEIHRSGLVEWYVNSEAGLEQGFTLAERPRGEGELVFELALAEATASASGADMVFRTPTGRRLAYGALHVVDATGRSLTAHFELPARDRVRIAIDDAGAAYPVTVDPLLTQAADAQLVSDQMVTDFGISVASAGDVNGDGYADVIVGAPDYDAGVDGGAAFLFHGGATGIPSGDASAASATLESDQAGASFGRSVASAGDVNGDGYADVIVGASGHDVGEGAAFVFHGSATGIPSGGSGAAATQLESGQGGSFGTGVASAGDVNGDGYADVIVSAPMYEINGSDGAAFVFHGSAAGVASGSPASAASQLEPDSGQTLGTSVASAGDVNADGYADVIVGAAGHDMGEGAAFVYHGSASGIPSGTFGVAATQLESDQGSSKFGASVASAGDVNGDGYADVIIGAFWWDAGESDEGVAFIFHGSASGVASAGTESAASQLESDLNDAEFGSSVASAGDVNGDGYGDVVVGASGHDGGEGASYVFLGRSSGIPSGNLSTAVSELESDSNMSGFGTSVASAGDVNGDGYADVMVGAPDYEIGEGAVFVYHGGAQGIVDGNAAMAAAQLEANQGRTQLGWSVASAGDVNGDGYGDVIVGAPAYDAVPSDEGAAFVFLGSAAGIAAGSPANAAAQLESNQAGAGFGFSVASAGDVNGDGYGDVIVGAHGYTAGLGEGGAGAAFLFHGSPSGVADGNPATAAAHLQAHQALAQFGSSVGSAGDVNGDGYADVIVGARLYDAGQSNEGAAFVFLGSASGVGDGNPATAAAQLESNQADANLGWSVSSAGDVNGDGYADVVAGARYFDSPESDEGAAFVFHGSASGIADGNPTTAAAQIESDQVNAYLGISVAAAGDVNGDGYGDVIVGAYRYSAPHSSEGAAFVFHGSASGVGDGNPTNADTQLESNQSGAILGVVVASAGDVNGDGYADVIVGANAYDAGTNDEGAAFVFLGSSAGIPDGNPATAAAQLESDQGDSDFGFSVASAGDVNGDGFGDLIVGAQDHDLGQINEGVSFVFYGNGNRTGRRLHARQLNGGGSMPVAAWGASPSVDRFQARLNATDPQGRGRVKLEVQACPPGAPFGHASCTSGTTPTWTDTTATSTGVSLTRQIAGLTPGTLYHWRARVQHAPFRVTESGITPPPSPAHGPWFRFQAQAFEGDLRPGLDFDGDGDGLPDAFELAYGLDPLDPDEDGDSRIDGQDDFDGDGLGNAAEYLAGTNPNVADSDGDTLPDGQEIGTGIFGGQLVISTVAGGAWSVSAADVDGDGDTDALSASYLSWKVAWHENDGTPSVGAWSEHAISTATLGATSAVASDVDGDGDTDVISTSFVDDRIAWHENDGTPSVGVWSEHVISTPVDSPDDAVAADVDGDGDPDVIAALFYEGRIAWYENDGTPSVGAWTEHEISTGDDGVDSVVAADLDGDGDTDVLSSSFYDDKIAWFENDGTPTVGSWTEHAISTAADSAESVFAADVDGDGDPDVLSASLYDDKIAWYENDGTPSVGSWIERSISTTTAGAVSVFAVDVDADGDTDVLSASYNDDTIAWYENDGTPLLGSWAKHVISTAADAGLSVVAADVDGDGDTDVLSASNLDNKIAWYAQANVADPLDPDSDSDGLLDGPEVALGTDPQDEDSDGDFVCDGGAQAGSCTAVGPDNCPFIPNDLQTNGDPYSAGDDCQCGDVTGDGPLDATDYQRAREHVAGRTPSGPFDPDRCDVTGDGLCTVEDLALLDRLTSGASASIVYGCEAWTGP